MGFSEVYRVITRSLYIMSQGEIGFGGGELLKLRFKIQMQAFFKHWGIFLS